MREGDYHVLGLTNHVIYNFNYKKLTTGTTEGNLRDAIRVLTLESDIFLNDGFKKKKRSIVSLSACF